jgi:predicted Zn-dependent protease with MMP-like domain
LGAATVPQLLRVSHPGFAVTAHNWPVPVVVSQQQFEDLVEQAIDRVPQRLLALMDNVVILVANVPPNDSPDLLGLYEGFSLTQRGWDYSGVLPDRITIFRYPILRRCTNQEEVVREVCVTVVHEIAHHFGIDDERLEELGWG